MAIDFGKVNRSVAFNPTSAFPLDARSYFESYELAEAAAASAEPVGSTNTQYYIGQQITVVENGIVSFYIIQPSKKLEQVGKSTPIDENLFEYDENGNLTLAGSKEANKGDQLSIDENGKLIWVKPIDAYTKSEVYTKQETENKIAESVAAAAHLKRKVVESIDDIDVNAFDADQYIYMVPALEGFVNDIYDEYIIIDEKIEKVGSWEVDLSDYVKSTDLETLLNSKVDKVEGSRLITNAEGEKLGSIKDLVKSVNNTDFTLDENGQLNLNQISISKISNLENQLNGKVDKIEGWTLLSPTDQAKLNSLVVGDNGNIEVSGKVNAENVQGLDDWITSNIGVVPGLSEKNFTTTLEAKLNGIENNAERNFIASVDTNQMEVVNKQLSIKSISVDKVDNLTNLLNAKASVESVNTVINAVNTLETKLNNQMASISDRLDVVEDALTWKTIS